MMWKLSTSHSASMPGRLRRSPRATSWRWTWLSTRLFSTNRRSRGLRARRGGARTQAAASRAAQASSPSRPSRSARIGPSLRGSISTTGAGSISRLDGVVDLDGRRIHARFFPAWRMNETPLAGETPHMRTGTTAALSTEHLE